MKFLTSANPINFDNTMGVLKQIAEYFYLRKRDPDAPHTQWMKYMHGINRISLFMFVVALVIIFLKLVIFRKN